MIVNRSHLEWPFFDALHRTLAGDVERWALGAVQRLETEAEFRHRNDQRTHDEYVEANVDAICRRHVASLGAAGLLRYCVPERFGGKSARVDSRRSSDMRGVPV